MVSHSQPWVEIYTVIGQNVYHLFHEFTAAVNIDQVSLTDSLHSRFALERCLTF